MSYVEVEYQSERHACRLLELGRSTHRYRAQRGERDVTLRVRLKELAAYMRFGYRRLTAMLVREGMPANHKRVYRLYREEGLAMRIRGGLRVGRVLDRIASERGLPEAIVVANRPGVSPSALAAWSEQRRVRLEFIRPGKLVQNAYTESFNGRRDECLNANWFTSVSDAQRRIEVWRARLQPGTFHPVHCTICRQQNLHRHEWRCRHEES